MKRDNGYYWIKPKDKDWIISYSYLGLFKHLGHDNTIEWLSDKELDDIDNTILFKSNQHIQVYETVTIGFKSKDIYDAYNSLTDMDKNELLKELAKVFNRLINKSK